MRLLLFVTCFLITQTVFAQNTDTVQAKIDSLKHVIASSQDEKKIEALQLLVPYFVFTDAKHAIELNREAIAEASAINYENLNQIHAVQIFCFVLTGQYDSAELQYQKALTLTKPGDKTLGRIYTNAGSLYLSSGQYAKALTHYHLAKTVAEQFDDQRQIMTLNLNIALVHERLNNLKSAMKHDSLAYSLAVTLKVHETMNLALNNLGAHLKQSNMLPQALQVFKKIKKNNPSEYLRGLIYLNMAEIKFIQELPDSAVYFGHEALKIFKQQNSIFNITGAYLSLSHAELLRGNLSVAEQYALLAHQSSSERNVIKEMQASAFILMKIHLQKNNLKVSREYEKVFHQLTDSLEKENQSKATIEVLTKYDTEKKIQENELLKRDQQIQNEKFTRQRYVMVFIVIALFLVIVLLIIAYRSYTQKQRTNTILQQQKENIKKQNQHLHETLAELRTTQEQLVHSEKMASLGKMTAGIAHEINNPLAFIQAGSDNLKPTIKNLKKVLDEYELLTVENYAEQIKKIEALKKQVYFKELFPDLQTIIETIKVGSTRTAKIIAGMQRFSRKGKEDVVIKDMGEIINETLVLILGETRNKITIHKNYAPGILIECRPVEIGQVLLNLLINAIHAMKDSGEITIGCSEENAHAVITISDTGSGIPPEVLSKIFDPFFTTKEVGKGTGLGLSITHGIVKSHGGNIAVASTLGVGTTFTITLPVKQV